MESFRENFNLSYFLQAFGIGLLVICLLFGWIEWRGNAYIQNHWQSFEPESIEIDWTGIPESDLARLLEKQGEDLSLQKKPLDGANTQSFTKNTPYGPVPKISEDGTTPFEAFRRPYSQPEISAGFSLVSVVVLDYCQSEKSADLVIKRLPSNTSLTLNPYCDNLESVVSRARKFGHEIWLGLPMETPGYPIDDLGPMALMVNDSVQSNRLKTQKIMARATEYVGLVSYIKPLFTKSERDFTPVMNLIQTSGLAFFETNTVPDDYLLKLSRATKLPFANADIHIDKKMTEFDIKAQLLKLERVASEQEYAIGFIQASPLAINMVAEWTRTLPEKKLSYVPLSALAGY